MSRGRFWYTDWSLHPEVAEQVWERFGRPSVDRFDSQVNTKCPLFFSNQGENTPGPGRLRSLLAQGPALCFPSVGTDPPDARAGQASGTDCPADSSRMGHVEIRDNSFSLRRALDPPSTQTSAATGGERNLPSQTSGPGSQGLARERSNLSTAGLTPAVVTTIQSARPVSTRSLYDS